MGGLNKAMFGQGATQIGKNGTKVCNYFYWVIITLPLQWNMSVEWDMRLFYNIPDLRLILQFFVKPYLPSCIRLSSTPCWLDLINVLGNKERKKLLEDREPLLFWESRHQAHTRIGLYAFGEHGLFFFTLWWSGFCLNMIKLRMRKGTNHMSWPTIGRKNNTFVLLSTKQGETEERINYHIVYNLDFQT